MQAMRPIILLSMFLFAGLESTFSQALTHAVPALGVLKFEAVWHDFRELSLGADGAWKFTFINVGTANLQIHDVQCSDQQAIEWPHDPIAPGIENGLRFGIPTDQLGFVVRQCTLSTDGTPATQVLTVSGNVLPKVAPALTSMTYPAYETVTLGGLMTFEEETHDFGDVEQGGDVYCHFRFTNTGTTWLRIDAVKCSGMMPPNYSHEQVAPGETAEIGIKYDSNRIGEFNKSFAVQSNAVEQVKVLRIMGRVLRKEPDPFYNAPMEGASFNGH